MGVANALASVGKDEVLSFGTLLLSHMGHILSPELGWALVFV